MSHEGAIARCSDDMIQLVTTREDGVEYYRLGSKITVSYRGKEKFFCHTCVSAQACVHTERVAKWRREN